MDSLPKLPYTAKLAATASTDSTPPAKKPPDKPPKFSIEYPDLDLGVKISSNCTKNSEQTHMIIDDSQQEDDVGCCLEEIPSNPKADHRNKGFQVIDSKGSEQIEQNHKGGTQTIPSYKSKLIQSSPHQFFPSWLNSFEDWQQNDKGTESAQKPDNSFPTITFPRETLERIRAPWRKTLILYAGELKISGIKIESHLRRLWKIQSTLTVTELGKHFFNLRMGNPEEYFLALAGGPWFLFNQYLHIQQWEPNFRPSKAKLDRMFIWVQLPEMPMEYYDFDSLNQIAQELGRPIKVDLHTNHQSRKGKYARLCVEVDTNKPLQPAINLFDSVQTLHYELKSLFCFSCGLIGHMPSSCPQSNKNNSSSIGADNNNKTGADNNNKTFINQNKELSHDNSNAWHIISSRPNRRNNSTSKSNNANQNQIHKFAPNNESQNNYPKTKVQQVWKPKSGNKSLDQANHTDGVSNIKTRNSFEILQEKENIDNRTDKSEVKEFVKINNSPQNLYSVEKKGPSDTKVKLDIKQSPLEPCINSRVEQDNINAQNMEISDVTVTSYVETERQNLPQYMVFPHNGSDMQLRNSPNLHLTTGEIVNPINKNLPNLVQIPPNYIVPLTLGQKISIPIPPFEPPQLCSFNYGTLFSQIPPTEQFSFTPGQWKPKPLQRKSTVSITNLEESDLSPPNSPKHSKQTHADQYDCPTVETQFEFIASSKSDFSTSRKHGTSCRPRPYQGEGDFKGFMTGAKQDSYHISQYDPIHFPKPQDVPHSLKKRGLRLRVGLQQREGSVQGSGLTLAKRTASDPNFSAAAKRQCEVPGSHAKWLHLPYIPTPKQFNEYS